MVETRFGRFYVDPVSQFGLALLSESTYELDMEKFLCATLHQGMTFVDVGANEGYFSVLAASLVGRNGRVLAVEPQARLRSVIERNCELNNAQCVEILAVAVSDRQGVGELHISPDTNSGSTGLSRFTKYRLNVQETPVVTLGEVLREHSIARIDVLKMDIESYEYEAILGAKEVFSQRRIAYFALEIHPTLLERRGLDPIEITNFLEAQGYELDSRFNNLVYRARPLAKA